MITLLLGGTRSGKSRFAEQLAQESQLDVTYVATALPLDHEMRTRIAQHRRDRPKTWKTVEESIDLATCLLRHARGSRCIIVDCLTAWITNLVFADDPKADIRTLFSEGPALYGHRTDLLSILHDLPGEIILVANDLGMSAVAGTALTRFVVDENGRFNQLIAAEAHHVALMVAGCPLWIKRNSVSPPSPVGLVSIPVRPARSNGEAL